MLRATAPSKIITQSVTPVRALAGMRALRAPGVCSWADSNAALVAVTAGSCVSRRRGIVIPMPDCAVLGIQRVAIKFRWPGA